MTFSACRALSGDALRPEAYFSRLRREGRAVRRPKLRRRSTFKMRYCEIRAFAKFAWRMTITHPDLRPHFWQTIFDCVRSNPAALKPVIVSQVFIWTSGDPTVTLWAR